MPTPDGRPTLEYPANPNGSARGIAGRLRPHGPHLRPDAPSGTIYRLLATPALDPKRGEIMRPKGTDANLSKRRRIVTRLSGTAEAAV